VSMTDSVVINNSDETIGALAKKSIRKLTMCVFS